MLTKEHFLPSMYARKVIYLIHMDIRRKGIVGTSLASYFKQLIVHSAVITSSTKAFNTPSLIFSYALIPYELDRLLFCEYPYEFHH